VKNIFQEDEGNLLQVNAYNPNANIKIKDILEVKEGLTFDDVLLFQSGLLSFLDLKPI